MKKYAPAVIVAACFFILDRFLKVWFTQSGEAVKNYQAAFSLSFGFDILWLAALVIACALVWLIFSLLKKDALATSALIILLLGAGANFYDRLVYGYVIDYLQLPPWLVFNLADLLVVGGALLLGLQELKKK
jgi:signal peptidase II